MTKKNQLARIPPPKKNLQLELPLFAGDLSFFYMMSGQLKQGLVAKIGASAFAVLVILRAHAQVMDGRVYLSLGELQRLTGMATNTVRSALKTLQDERLIQVHADTDRSKRRYFVVDLVPFKRVKDEDLTAAMEALEAGNSDGSIAVRYVPRTSQRDRQEIQHFLNGGAAPSSPNVQLIQEQSVGQQIVQNQFIQQNINVVVQAPAGASADDHAAFVQETLDRVRQKFARTTTAAMKNQVVDVQIVPQKEKD